MTKRSEVARFVAHRIGLIEHGSSPGDAKAELANLRRGLGKQPGELPELWGSFLEDIPGGLVGKGKKPSAAENAIYTAMTLYALAHQGADPAIHSANQKDITLGRAAGRYAGADETDRERMERRLKSILSSETVEDMGHGIRGIIQLIRDKDIRLDFPRLAADLYTYSFPEGKEQVRLEWARDFYRREKTDTKDNQEKENN